MEKEEVRLLHLRPQRESHARVRSRCMIARVRDANIVLKEEEAFELKMQRENCSTTHQEDKNGYVLNQAWAKYHLGVEWDQLIFLLWLSKFREIKKKVS